MDEIQKIVFEIADRCQRRKVPVTDMLAAFVGKARDSCTNNHHPAFPQSHSMRTLPRQPARPDTAKHCIGNVPNDLIDAFLVQTIILENPEKFQLDRAMSPEDVEQLVSLAVARLSKEDDPSLETLRMQVAFDSTYVEKQEALEKEKASTKRAYSLLEQSICAAQFQSTKDVSGMGQMHRLIIAALLTRTGQNPSNEVFQREVAAALESVLPRANLFPFTTLDYGDKRDRLADLHHYVLGIRLFNKAMGKGGNGLGDKVKEISEQVMQLAEAVVAALIDAEGIIEDYQSVINHVHKTSGAEQSPQSAALMQRLQDELAYKRQYLSFLQSFEHEMATSQEQIHNVVLEYDAHMEELRELVGRKSAVPKERVYPLFEGLAKLWMEAKDLEMHSTALQGIFDQLSNFAVPKYTTQLKEEDVLSAHQAAPADVTAAAEVVAGEGGEALGGEGGAGAPEKEKEVVAATGEQIVSALDPASTTPVHVFKSENPEIIQLPVEFTGFCPHTMATRAGLLLPGDPTNGNILYEGKLYGFVSMDALLAFLKTPDVFLEGVLKEAKRKPELINLLSLDRQFPHHVLRKVPTRSWPHLTTLGSFSKFPTAHTSPPIRLTGRQFLPHRPLHIALPRALRRGGFHSAHSAC